ncbi:hypothetical protein PoB_002514200 [Plakobranchus ocellatus]|uniref:Uncharacterized protein n=1 Tax=Plakobranchus ocellatus TaxID=259542 RepID=A0AAV3ZVD1_9GAST|nr:hypothetical protein PoB_002514200 [Plakobranchus ocellatus]
MELATKPTPCLLACLVFVALLMPGLGQESQESPLTERELQASLGLGMDNVQQQLADVTSSTEEMLSKVESAISDCLGTHSELCEALEVEAGLADKLGLQSHWSPGKRFSKRAHSKRAGTYMANSLYKDLLRKRAVAQQLGSLFHGANEILRKEK